MIWESLLAVVVVMMVMAAVVEVAEVKLLIEVEQGHQ
jgi:hypothetical protein